MAHGCSSPKGSGSQCLESRGLVGRHGVRRAGGSSEEAVTSLAPASTGCVGGSENTWAKGGSTVLP